MLRSVREGQKVKNILKPVTNLKWGIKISGIFCKIVLVNFADFRVDIRSGQGG